MHGLPQLPSTLPSRTGAGYVATPAATSRSFTSASGTWRQPAPTCRRGDDGGAAAVWVGLGGYDAGADELEQIGSMVGCDTRTRPVERAWFAVLPYPPHTIGHRVHAGDVLTAAVAALPTAVLLQLIDRTAGWSFTRTISALPPDTTSAEWIVEAPLSCVFKACRQASLADFHALTFTAIGAATDAETGTLADAAWTATALRLTPGKEAGTAVPGPLDPGGASFTVTWQSAS